MGYVIQRSDGKYVTPPGSERSYTDRLQNARFFLRAEQAEREVCPDNERVVALDEILPGGRS